MFDKLWEGRQKAFKSRLSSSPPCLWRKLLSSSLRVYHGVRDKSCLKFPSSLNTHILICSVNTEGIWTDIQLLRHLTCQTSVNMGGVCFTYQEKGLTDCMCTRWWTIDVRSCSSAGDKGRRSRWKWKVADRWVCEPKPCRRQCSANGWLPVSLALAEKFTSASDGCIQVIFKVVFFKKNTFKFILF